MLFRFISYLVKLVRKDSQKALNDIEKAIVKRYSRGNVRLQLGNYLTEADINEMRENSLHLKF